MIECNAIKEQRTANRRLVKKRVQCLLGVLCFVLSAEQYSSRQDFITKSIQDSYKVLENKIIEFPTQWTSWLTIQNLFLRDYSTPFDKNYVPKNKFNDDRYTLFVVNNSCFLFDLFDYQS